MESPYYEMTHDIEEENRLFQSGYIKGYRDAMMKFPSMIIRCKNCKHGFPLTDSTYITCGRRFHDGQKHEADWFCGDAEQKDS